VAFALVHFTVGFAIVLVALSASSLTRYRLTGAYLGGIWALVPDLHHLFDGAIGDRILVLHGSPRADVFFFHHTLDGASYRAHNVELTFVSLAVLGVAFAAYDRRFGLGLPAVRVIDATEDSDETT
jgi:hypothetical protein